VNRHAILAFDTSAAHCAAALLIGDRVSHRLEVMDKGQAERLMPMLESLLAESGIGWPDLAAIGVGTGPGNATGVRIAVAAARGLALGLGIPAIGVTVLEATAHGLPRPLAVVQDARRGEVYVQIFDPEPGQPHVMAVADAVAMIGDIAVTGSAAAEIAALTQRRIVIPACPLAEAIARLAQDRSVQVQARPAPFYLRGADAAPPSDPPVVILP
jgi:tRNA threonylcarbamoyladenosine biosynthesis protein TsaB